MAGRVGHCGKKHLDDFVRIGNGACEFALRRASFRGDGLVAGQSLRDWESIRELVYPERGA